ncbi:hypothetical protein [Methylibium rhizosphaerae]|uniref:hypothetical protein n=1 Tax=Methylibium rhizosphaerae TaxID=2570323 RepID=UPI00112DF3F2|nr:hypothetical protein [Methylibium rhizosphaerae]
MTAVGEVRPSVAVGGGEGQWLRFSETIWGQSPGGFWDVARRIIQRRPHARIDRRACQHRSACGHRPQFLAQRARFVARSSQVLLQLFDLPLGLAELTLAQLLQLHVPLPVSGQTTALEEVLDRPLEQERRAKSQRDKCRRHASCNHADLLDKEVNSSAAIGSSHVVDNASAGSHSARRKCACFRACATA